MRYDKLPPEAEIKEKLTFAVCCGESMVGLNPIPDGDSLKLGVCGKKIVPA